MVDRRKKKVWQKILRLLITDDEVGVNNNVIRVYWLSEYYSSFKVNIEAKTIIFHIFKTSIKKNWQSLIFWKFSSRLNSLGLAFVFFMSWIIKQLKDNSTTGFNVNMNIICSKIEFYVSSTHTAFQHYSKCVVQYCASEKASCRFYTIGICAKKQKKCVGKVHLFILWYWGQILFLRRWVSHAEYRCSISIPVHPWSEASYYYI